MKKRRIGISPDSPKQRGLQPRSSSPCIRGMEVIFKQLMEKFGARLEEISVVQLDGFRAATIHAYENVIDN